MTRPTISLRNLIALAFAEASAQAEGCTVVRFTDLSGDRKRRAFQAAEELCTKNDAQCLINEIQPEEPTPDQPGEEA
jgi:thiamine monophosphate synthase